MRLIFGLIIIYVLLSSTVTGIELKTDLQGVGETYSNTDSTHASDYVSSNGVQSYHMYLFEDQRNSVFSSNYTLSDAKNRPSRVYSVKAAMQNGSITPVVNNGDPDYLEGSNKYLIRTTYLDGTVHFVKMDTAKKMFSRSWMEMSDNSSGSEYRIKTFQGDLDLGVVSKNYMGRPDLLESLKARGDMELSSQLKNNVTFSPNSEFDDLKKKMESVPMMEHGYVVKDKITTDVLWGGNPIVVTDKFQDKMVIGDTMFSFNVPAKVEKKMEVPLGDPSPENVSEYWIYNDKAYVPPIEHLQPTLDIVLSPEKISPNMTLIPTITLRNIGDGTIDSVDLSVKLPPGMEVINSSDGKIHGKSLINWSEIGPIGSGDANSKMMTFKAKILDIPANVTNLTVTFNTNFIRTGENTPYSTTIPLSVARPALSLGIESDCMDCKGGDRITYLINLSNTGDDPLNGLSVVYDLPEGVKFKESYPDCIVSGRKLMWQGLGELDSGEERTISCSVDVESFPLSKNVLNNVFSASATSDTGVRMSKSSQFECVCTNSTGKNVTIKSARLRIMSVNQTSNISWSPEILVDMRSDKKDIDDSDENRITIYSVNITNNGNVFLDRIDAEDRIPVGLNYIEGSGQYNPKQKNRFLVWNITDASLMPGKSMTLIFKTDINDSIEIRNIGPTLTNTIEVKATNITNNQSVRRAGSIDVRYNLLGSVEVNGMSGNVAPIDTGFENISEISMRKHIQLGETLLRKKKAFVGWERTRPDPNKYFATEEASADFKPLYNPTSKIYVIGNCNTMT